jgi:tetratricopeptide (TPR) repeat protein
LVGESNLEALLGQNSADQFFHHSSRSADDLRGRHARARMPSSAGYLAVALVLAAGLFFLLWWMLLRSGDEAPWLPAGLAASVVLLVALSAREVVMRRAWNRYLLDNGINQKHPSHSSSRSSSRSSKKGFSASLHSSALRAIQKQSSAADLPGSTPESHLDVAHLCHDYLSSTDEAMRSGRLGSEKGIAIRSGQERVRALHKHHLLTWARGHARALTHEAQQRARTFDKIETANKALECIDSALRVYPNEPELNESKIAIGEFIASVKVAHWVELAERSAFKGHYRRAIDRYRDALFYLNQEVVKEDVRVAGTEKIERQIAELQSRLRPSSAGRQPVKDAEFREDQ